MNGPYLRRHVMAVSKQHGLPAAARHLYCMMACLASEGGTLEMKNDDLAQMLGMTARNVQNLTPRMVAAGAIEVRARRRSGKSYRLLLAGRAAEQTEEIDNVFTE